MQSSKRITSLFIGVAIATLIVLALSVERKKGLEEEVLAPLIPGLTEHVLQVSRISGVPAEKFRSVVITRTNGEQMTATRQSPKTMNYEVRAPEPGDMLPFSAILYANASFLNTLPSPNAFTVTGLEPENTIGELKYTTFDGLVLKLEILESDNELWLRLVAAYAPKLAERFAEDKNLDALPADRVIDIANRLNGRLYKDTRKNL